MKRKLLLMLLPLRPKKRSSNSCFALNAQKADLRVGFFYGCCTGFLIPVTSGMTCRISSRKRRKRAAQQDAD